MIREMMTRWLILVGKVAPRLVRQLHGTGFSLVLVDMRPPIRDADGVICDDGQGAYEATRHLIKLGHRRIALIRGPARHPFSQALTSGYRRALQEAGMPVREGYVVEAPLRPEGGYEAAEVLLKGPSHPTAIFTNDDVAIPKEEMGRLAVRRAIAQMEEGERHVFSTTVVSHTLLIRSSCGAGRLRLPRRSGRSHP